MTDISSLKAGLLADIIAADTLDEVEGLRVGALGKSGVITGLLKTLGGMSPEERQARGPAIHDLREGVTAAIAERKSALEQAALDARLSAERIDMTLPADIGPVGSVHPVSQVMDELAEIFADLGFSVATGPEIEDDWHNFTALNIPETHPARAMHDTFYLAGEHERPMVLRTHTSPVQIRTMMTQAPPIRIIAPGRVYRSDSDATHTPMFHQVEGLLIDRHTHMGHLKGCLIDFVRSYFERDDVPVRFRPSFFPFTEPSAEVDIGCRRTRDELKIGEGSDWLEILGCGMVHPKVLAAVGLDPDEWQGFAFGMGIDRVAMLKYGIPDLRTFFEADLRWLKHYGFLPLDVPNLAHGLAR